MATVSQGKDEDDVEDKLRDTRGDQHANSSYLEVMNSYGREFIFLIALVFTAIAALQNGPLKTKKVNPPQFFFSPPSLVTDFYQGNLNGLISLISEKDIAFVLYYAPWDASSIQARDEIETVAKFYHHEVFFAAINCWWPEGECSKKYSIAFPLAVAHVHEVGTVRYDGPLVSAYITAFLDSVLSPLVPLHHTGELLDLLTKHEGVLVAFFEFKDGTYPNGYKQFYSASLRALTTDPNRKLCFAVITNRKVAIAFKLKSPIQLFLWNSIEMYYETSIRHLEVLQWAYSKLQQVSQWIAPLGMKSNVLSQIIEKRPTLILFTPRNLFIESSPYYHLFREVALDYNNCNKSSHVTSLIHRIVLKRHILQEELAKLVEKCHRNISEQYPDICQRNPQICDLTCCQTLHLDLGYHRTCHCRACLHHVVHSIQEMKFSECENTLNLVLKSFKLSELKSFGSCNDVEVSFSVKFGEYRRLSFKCETESPFSPTNIPRAEISQEEISQVKDDNILMMVQSSEKQLCQRLKYALNYSDINFPDFPTSDNASWHANFTGLGCQTNKTLVFIAMDVVLYHAFAENLGLDVSNSYHQTTAVITEAMQESQYILNEHLNKKILVEFIKNYTVGTLDRHLRMPIRKIGNCMREGDSDFCLEEVTTETFNNIVLDNKQDVVLLYYASWCGACSAIAHIFLTVADYFSNVEGIKFARISGEDNDLPWEYTVEKYPTIIFFPAKRKSESVEFPPHLSITMSHLLHFVLVHTQPKVRWTVAMEMCNKECVAHNLIQSSKELRRLFREHHILLSDLYFVRQVIAGPKKSKISKKSTQQKFSRDFNVNYFKNVYLSYLIDRIREKRGKIRQAFRLQSTLRKKRDIYLKEMKDKSMDKLRRLKKTKFADLRQRIRKDEL